jgi:UDP-N-acetylglucosamine--N-acetylmuramyl-(pentapeptide) pyrophosphoryl-undecaprenol N-acetylglucosamine transferase
MTPAPRIIITGGGTGGHVYPALVIAKEIKRLNPQSEILFVGNPRGLESKVIPREGFSIQYVDVDFFSRKMILKNLKTFWKAALGTIRARGIIRRFRPDVVVGTGGYVSGPVVLAAVQKRIPTLIQEQNAFPGLTTRLLAGKADVVAVSHKDAVKRITGNAKIMVTGHPIRRELLEATRSKGREALGVGDDTPLVLVVGGSGGAEVLNRVCLESAAAILAEDARVIHVTGPRYFQWAQKVLSGQNLTSDQLERYQLVDYMHDFPQALAACDIIISRAGGTTHEINVLGKPAILIPSPNVTDDHQLHNAHSLATAGAALVIEERELSVNLLGGTVRQLLDDAPRLAKMAEASKQLGKPDAGERIAEKVLQLAEGR